MSGRNNFSNKNFSYTIYMYQKEIPVAADKYAREPPVKSVGVRKKKRNQQFASSYLSQCD